MGWMVDGWMDGWIKPAVDAAGPAAVLVVVHKHSARGGAGRPQEG